MKNYEGNQTKQETEETIQNQLRKTGTKEAVFPQADPISDLRFQLFLCFVCPQNFFNSSQ